MESSSKNERGEESKEIGISLRQASEERTSSEEDESKAVQSVSE
jgi:hypothetical protein